MKKSKFLSGGYRKIIRDISVAIRQSRYAAARSVNKSEWGDGTLSFICEGIQNNFPGIRGFSISNLKNMRQFYDAYSDFQIGQLPTGQLKGSKKSQLVTG